MKRKFAGVALFACTLACVMGASSITFNQGQPVPNPKGAKQILSAAGTYAVDPAETFVTVTYNAENTATNQLAGVAATANNGNWNATLSLVAGKYDNWGTLYTTNNATGATVKTLTATVTSTVN